MVDSLPGADGGGSNGRWRRLHCGDYIALIQPNHRNTSACSLLLSIPISQAAPRMNPARPCRRTFDAPPTLCLRVAESVSNCTGTLLTSYQLTTKIIKPKMESLLSLSFDYLSSYDGVKIRKGLRQLEGLLAQICLSRTPIDRRSSVVSNGTSKQTTKELSSLKNDPAFREFFKLQEGFEWNGTRAHPPLLI